MRILAIEFSPRQPSVALGEVHAGGPCHVLARVETTAKQTRSLVALNQRLWAESGLNQDAVDAIGVGVGPGSVGGIRRAIAFALGWSIGCRVKVIAVSSFQAMAREALVATGKTSVLILFSGPGNELYLSRYGMREGRVEEQDAPLPATARACERLAAASDLVATADQTDFHPIKKWLGGARIMAIHPTACSLLRWVASRQRQDPILPLSPIRLRVPHFTKAPPPRTVPPITR